MQNKVYNLHEDFKGDHSVLVPVRMYSRIKLLQFMHLKDNKWLGVNLNRYVLTFHGTKDPTNFNPKEEVPFSHIKGLKADVAQADKQKFYLTVITDEEDYKFKFNNSRDFHAVVDCLRNTLDNGKPMMTTDEGYDETVRRIQNMTGHQRSGSVSSDDVDEFRSGEELKDYRKDMLKLDQKEDCTLKREDEMVFIDDSKKGKADPSAGIIAEQHLTASEEKDQLEFEFKQNKDQINNEYEKQMSLAKAAFEFNKHEIDKEVAKSTYDHAVRQAKVLRDARLEGNREVYEAAMADIKAHERTEKDAQKELNKEAVHFGVEKIKEDVHNLKSNLKNDYHLYKDGTEVDKEVAKKSAKVHFQESKDGVKSHIKEANEIRNARS